MIEHDEDQIRDRVDRATEQALRMGERLSDHVLAHSADPFAVALAVSLKDVTGLIGRFKRALRVEVSG